MKLKTKHWESNDPEKKVMPYWSIATFAVANCAFGIYMDINILVIMNVIFILVGVLPILSYNKWRKESANIKTGEKEQSKENQSIVQ